MVDSISRYNSSLEEVSKSGVTPLEEDSGKLMPGFLWNLPWEPFPFMFALYPFAAVSHNNEYEQMLSPCEFPNLRLVLVTADIKTLRAEVVCPLHSI